MSAPLAKGTNTVPVKSKEGDDPIEVIQIPDFSAADLVKIYQKQNELSGNNIFHESWAGIGTSAPASSLEGLDVDSLKDYGIDLRVSTGNLKADPKTLDPYKTALSEEQGFLGQLKAATIQLPFKTVAGAASTLGLATELGSMALGNEFDYNNIIFEAANNLNKWVEELAPLHDDPTDDSAFTSENITRGVVDIPGIALGIGAVATAGKLGAKGIFNLTSKAIRKGLGKEVKGKAFEVFSAYGQRLGGMTASGATEGWMGAAQLYGDLKDQLDQKSLKAYMNKEIDEITYRNQLQENEDRATNSAHVTFGLGSLFAGLMNVNLARPDSNLFTNKLLKSADETFKANRLSPRKEYLGEMGMESIEEYGMELITGGGMSMGQGDQNDKMSNWIKGALEKAGSDDAFFAAGMGGLGGVMQKAVVNGFSKYVLKQPGMTEYNSRLKLEIEDIFKNNRELKTIAGIGATNEATKDIPKTSLDSINNLVANSVGNHTESYLRNAIKDAKKDLEQKAQDMQNPELAEQAKAQLENIGQVENQLFMAVRLRDGNYSLSNKVRETNPDSMPSYIYDLLDRDNRKFDLERANDLVNTYKKEVNGEKKEGSKKSKTPQAEYNLLPLVKDETTLEELKTIGEKARAITQGSDTELKPADIDVMINNDILTHSRNKNLGTNDPYELLSIQSMDPLINMEDLRDQYNDALDKAEMEIDNTDMASIPGKGKLNVKDIVEAENKRAEQEKALAEQTRVISEKYTTKALDNTAKAKKQAEAKEAIKKMAEKVAEDEKLRRGEAAKKASDASKVVKTEAPVEKELAPSEVPVASITRIGTEVKDGSLLSAKEPKSIITDPTLPEVIESKEIDDSVDKEYTEDKKKLEENNKDTALISNVTGVVEGVSRKKTSPTKSNSKTSNPNIVVATSVPLPDSLIAQVEEILTLYPESRATIRTEEFIGPNREPKYLDGTVVSKRNKFIITLESPHVVVPGKWSAGVRIKKSEIIKATEGRHILESAKESDTLLLLSIVYRPGAFHFSASGGMALWYGDLEILNIDDNLNKLPDSNILLSAGEVYEQVYKNYSEGTEEKDNLTGDVFTQEGTFQDIIENQETLFSRRLSDTDTSVEQLLTFEVYNSDETIGVTEDKSTEIIDDKDTRERFDNSIAIYTEDGRLIGFVTKKSNMYKQLLNNPILKREGRVTFKCTVYPGTTKPRFKKSGSPIKNLSDVAKAAFKRLFNVESKAFYISEVDGKIKLVAVGNKGTKLTSGQYKRVINAIQDTVGATVLATKDSIIALSSRILDSETVKSLYVNYASRFTGDIATQVTDFLTAFTNLPAHSKQAERIVSASFSEKAKTLNVHITDATGERVSVRVKSDGSFTEELLQSIVTALQEEDKIGDRLRTGLNYKTLEDKKIDTLEAVMAVFNTNLEFKDTSDGENSIYYKVANEMYIKISNESYNNPDPDVTESESLVDSEFNEDVAFATAFAPVSERVSTPVEYIDSKDTGVMEGVNKKEFHNSMITHIAFFVQKLGYDADKIAGLLNVDSVEAFLKKLNIPMTNPSHLSVLEHWLKLQQNNPDNFIASVQFEASKLTSFYTLTAKEEDEVFDVEESALEDDDSIPVHSDENTDYENNTDEAIKAKSWKQEWHKMEMDVQKIFAAVPKVNNAKSFIRSIFGTVTILSPIKLIENIITAVNLSDRSINSFTEFSDFIQTFKSSDNPYLNSFYYLWNALDTKSVTDPKIQMLQTKIYNHMKKSAVSLVTVDNNMTSGSESMSIKTHGITSKGVEFFSNFIIKIIGIMKNIGRRQPTVEKVLNGYNTFKPVIDRLFDYNSTEELDKAPVGEDRLAIKQALVNFFKDVYGIDLDRKGLDVFLSAHKGKYRNTTNILSLVLTKGIDIKALRSLKENSRLSYDEAKVYPDTGANAAEFAADISVLSGKTVTTPFVRIGGKSYYTFREPGLYNEIVSDEKSWNEKTVAETMGLPSSEAVKKVRRFKIQKLWGALRRTKRRTKNSETSTYTPREEFLSAMTMLFGLYEASDNPPLFTAPVISDTGDILVFGGHTYLKTDKTETFNTLYSILTEYAYREFITVLDLNNESKLEGWGGSFSVIFPDLIDVFNDPDFGDLGEYPSLEIAQKAKIEKVLKESFGPKTKDSNRFEVWYKFLQDNNLVHKSENSKSFGFTPLMTKINGLKKKVSHLEGLEQITGKLFTGTFEDEVAFKTALENSRFMEYYELVYLANHLHFYEKIGMPHTMAKIDKETGVTSAQATLDNAIKRAKSWVSTHTSARWLSNTFKVVVLKDENLKFVRVDNEKGSMLIKVTDKDAPYTIEVNTTDAQEYSTPLEFLETLIAYGHITEEDAFGMPYKQLVKLLEDLRMEDSLIGDSGQLFDVNGFITPESVEKYKDRLGENFINSKFYKLHSTDASGSDTLLVPEKNVYCGPDLDYSLSDSDKGLPGNRMVYIKSSTLPLIPANLSVVDKKGKSVPTNKHKLLAFMLRHGINRAAQESATKLGTRVGQVISMEELDNLSGKNVSERTFNLDRKYYGRQQVTQAAPKSKITMGTQLAYLLFEGDVTDPENEGLNQIRTQFIQALTDLLGTKQQKFLQDLGLAFGKLGNLEVKDIEKFNYQLAKSLDNYNDKLTTDLRSNFKLVKLGEDLEFSIPIDLVGNSEKLQESLASIVNKNLVRIKLPGTSCIQVSSNGFKMQESDALKAPVYNNETKSIEPGDAIITWPFGKEAWELYQTDDEFKAFVKERSTSIGFRIPTSGLPSATYLSITWISPDEGPIAVVSPVVVAMLGADFDVDKLNLYVRPLYDLWKIEKDMMKDANKIATVEAEDALFSIQESTFTGKTVDGKKVDIPVSRFNTMMNPIGTPTISGKIKKMQEAGINSYYDKTNPFGLLNIMNRRKVASESKILTSVFSVWVVALNKLQYYSKQTGKKLTDFIKLSSALPIIDGGVIDGSFPFIGKGSSKSASAFMSELQNYALDLAKDPNSDIPNINIYTSGVAGILTSLGYDMEFVINFIGNPIIKEYIRRKALRSDTMSTSGTSAYSTKDFLDELNTELTKNYKALSNLDIVKLNSNVLAATITNKNYTEALAHEDMDVAHLLKAFDIYEEAARKLIGEVKYTRQNSVGVPKNLYELIVWNRRYLTSAFAKLANKGSLMDTFTSYQEAFSTLEKMYFGRSFYKEQFFTDFIDALTLSGINVVDAISVVRSFMLRNIVKTKNMEHLLGPGDLTEDPSIIKFSEYLAIAKERYPDNRFLQSITLNPDTEDYLYAGIMKALPKIEFILKDGDEDYQKSDVADALMQDFVVLLNDRRSLIEDDTDNVSMADFMQSYIRYNYQVFSTSYRKGSILGLIPSSYITKLGSIHKSYNESLEQIGKLDTEVLLSDFANQNEDLIMKVDVRKVDKDEVRKQMDKINKIGVGGIVKDAKGNFYFVEKETANNFILYPVIEPPHDVTWKAIKEELLLSSSLLLDNQTLNQALGALDSIIQAKGDLKIVVDYSISGDKFGSYRASTNTMTLYLGKLTEMYGRDPEVLAAMQLYTILEELMHSQFKDNNSTLTKEVLMKFIHPKLDYSSKRVLKAYGLSDLDGDLTKKQLEELLILLARSDMGDPNLEMLIHWRASDWDFTKVLNEYIFSLSPLKSPGSLRLGSTRVLVTEEDITPIKSTLKRSKRVKTSGSQELLDLSTDSSAISQDNQPCKK